MNTDKEIVFICVHRSSSVAINSAINSSAGQQPLRIFIPRDNLTSMEIASATVDDVPAVLPMVAKIAALHESWDPAKFGYKDHPEEMYRGWLKGRATDPRSVFLVARREGRPIAFLVGTVETEIPI